MEVDADTLAVTSMADNLVHWLSNQPSLGARDFLRAHLFGFGVLFALMADAERLDRPPPERSHPRPHIRYFLAAPRVERIVTETHPAAFADANPISESYDELAKMFPSLWKTESESSVDIRTSELAELITTCTRLEPEFLAFANDRTAWSRPSESAPIGHRKVHHPET
jgi:hypothetical protein